MLSSQTRTIGEFTFTVSQLPAMKATKLFYRLSAVAVPVLGRAAQGLELDSLDMSKGAANANVNISSLLKNAGDAAQLFFEKMSEADFEKTVRELLETATFSKDGSEGTRLMPQFDVVLAGEVGVILQLVAFALEVNFKDFLPGLVARVKGAAAMASKSNSKGPQSPGPAGA